MTNLFAIAAFPRDDRLGLIGGTRQLYDPVARVDWAVCEKIWSFQSKRARKA